MKNRFVIGLAERWGFIQSRGVVREKGSKNSLSPADALAYFLILTISTFSGWVLANLFANTGFPHRGLDPVLTHSDWSLQGKSILTTVGVVTLFVTIHFGVTCVMHVSNMANLKTSALFKFLLVILLCLIVASLWVEYGNGIPQYNLYFKNALEFVAVWLVSSFVTSIMLQLIMSRSTKFKQRSSQSSQRSRPKA